MVLQTAEVGRNRMKQGAMRIELDVRRVAQKLGVPFADVRRAVIWPGLSRNGVDDRAVADAALELARQELRGRRVQSIQFERRGATMKIWAVCA